MSDQNVDNYFIDEFGIEHKDDIDDSSEDEDVNEADITRVKMAREAANITPSGNTTGVPNPTLMNSCQTWIGMDPVANQDEFGKDQLFSSLEELKRKITIYSTSKGKEYKVLKARDRWYTVVCVKKDQGCTWKLSAHKVGEDDNVWKISSYKGPHVRSCVRDVMHMDNHNINQKFIFEEIISLIQVDKTLKPRTIMEIIQKAYHVSITYERAWDEKQKAIASIFGDWEESYAILPRFFAAVVKFNPGTVVEWSTTSGDDGTGSIFQRVFWSFGPSIHGFKHCRPLITIDGTHMYGKYKGTLLIAMAVDANQQIFPLAFAVVESENGSSWHWFMDLIGRRVTDRTGLCVVSDRHESIIKAMKELPRWSEPNAYHRFCVRHVVSDLNKSVRNKHLKKLLGSTAYRHEEAEFDVGFTTICSKSATAKTFLEGIERDKWSLCHDGGFRYGVMTTNMSECFNTMMKGTRNLPITGLVRTTFYKLNAYFVERLGKAKERSIAGQLYSTAVQSLLEHNVTIARRAHVIPFNSARHVYEVHVPLVQEYNNRLTYIVDLTARTCTCQKWKNYKVACPHVLAVCLHKSFLTAAYVDPFYTTHALMRTYEMSFYPVGDMLDWPVIEGPPLKPNPESLRDVGKPGRRQET